MKVLIRQIKGMSVIEGVMRPSSASLTSIASSIAVADSYRAKWFSALDKGNGNTNKFLWIVADSYYATHANEFQNVLARVPKIIIKGDPDVKQAADLSKEGVVLVISDVDRLVSDELTRFIRIRPWWVCSFGYSLDKMRPFLKKFSWHTTIVS